MNFSDPFGLCPTCGDEAVDYYASVATDPSRSSVARGAANVGLAFASLWTSDTWGKTTLTLAGAGAASVGLRLIAGANAAAATATATGAAAASKIPFEGFQEWGRTAVGWGQNAAGAARAMAQMTAEKAAQLDPAKVQAAKAFYENAVANGKGGAAASARVELMQKILEHQQ